MKNEKIATVKKYATIVIGVTAATAVCVTGVILMANQTQKTLDKYDPERTHPDYNDED
jgi:hypothetical protein